MNIKRQIQRIIHGIFFVLWQFINNSKYVQFKKIFTILIMFLRKPRTKTISYSDVF